MDTKEIGRRIGARLDHLKRYAGISAIDVGRTARPDLTNPACVSTLMSRARAGKGISKYQTLAALASAMDCDLHWLLTGEVFVEPIGGAQ